MAGQGGYCDSCIKGVERLEKDIEKHDKRLNHHENDIHELKSQQVLFNEKVCECLKQLSPIPDRMEKLEITVAPILQDFNDRKELQRQTRNNLVLNITKILFDCAIIGILTYFGITGFLG